MSGEEPIDLVATVHDLDPVVVTLRDVLHRSGALRVVVIVDRAEPAIVDVGRLPPVDAGLVEATPAGEAGLGLSSAAGSGADEQAVSAAAQAPAATRRGGNMGVKYATGARSPPRKLGESHKEFL